MARSLLHQRPDTLAQTNLLSHRLHLQISGGPYILGEGFRITAVAVGLGLLLAFGIEQVLPGFLFEVRGIEPVVLLVAAAVLMAVALVACYIPARKASLVDPIIALRYE